MLKVYLNQSWEEKKKSFKVCSYRDCLESLLQKVSLLHDGLQDRQRDLIEVGSDPLVIQN